MSSVLSSEQAVDFALSRVTRAGAEGADALLVEYDALNSARRLGRSERLERSESRDLGLRVFIGHRQGIVSTSDFSENALSAAAARAVEIARAVPEDRYCGLAERQGPAPETGSLDLVDETEPSAADLDAMAAEAEDSARAVSGVTNSDGAEASWSRSKVTLVSSAGFRGVYRRTNWSLSVAVVAGESDGMERDYDFTAAVHGADLRSPSEVGRSAGERAVRRLAPRKIRSTRVPVVFEARVARSLVSHFASAINGAAVARGTTFLADKRGQKIFQAGIRMSDDPQRARGLGSRPFDAEGVVGRPLDLVADGHLCEWLLDCASARKLGLETNGRAVRSASSPPSPGSTNLYLAPGRQSVGTLQAEVGEGLLVTEMMGFGVNGVTGDYSRGAAGFWIENGAVSYPVSEITIAGNLLDMYAGLTPADDLVFRYGTDSPSVRIESMTIAGR